LKTKKKKVLKSRIRSTARAKKTPIKRRGSLKRPLHKRIALHPANVLLLLCVGVLLGGVTFHSFADSYTINAIVPASIPSAPAIITSPADQSHFTTSSITVSGTCPENSYVDLSDNNVFSGSAICGATQTTFAIDTDVALGSNVLSAQVYNVTNQPGPTSSPITVFLDNPVQPPAPTPASTPTTLQVTSQDNTAYSNGITTVVSPYVTERGTAPPYSYVVVTFHSGTLTCATYADAHGNWSCTLDQPLPPGIHAVDITARTPQGQLLIFPAFYIRVSAAIEPLQPAHQAAAPFFIGTDYSYTPRISGKSFSLAFTLDGGVAPYALSISWGDGSQSTIVRSNSDTFSVSHTYTLPSATQQTYLVKVQAADSTGASAFLEIAEVVHGNGWYPGIPLTTDSGGGSSPLSDIHQWLWLLWPAYGVTMLMVLSFWLGERQEYDKIFHRPIRRRHA
jgi:hypothetical protein